MSNGFVWDACCLLNLASTDRIEEIVSSLPGPSFAVGRILDLEVIYLRSLPNSGSDKLDRVDIHELLVVGRIQVTEMTAGEEDLFVELAQELDDGEAMSLAVASSRGLTLITDDRVAIRVARSLQPGVTVLSTPEWLKQWAETNPVSSQEIQGTLRRVGHRARFKPRATHELYSWWLSHYTG